MNSDHGVITFLRRVAGSDSSPPTGLGDIRNFDYVTLAGSLPTAEFASYQDIAEFALKNRADDGGDYEPTIKMFDKIRIRWREPGAMLTFLVVPYDDLQRFLDTADEALGYCKRRLPDGMSFAMISVNTRRFNNR